MRTDTNRGCGMFAEVRCPRCKGSVSLPAQSLRCAAEAGGDGGVCEFTCPICSRSAVLRTTAGGVEAVLEAGAERLSGLVPFEILEPHTGTPLSIDELLDFHAELDSICCPPEGLVK